MSSSLAVLDGAPISLVAAATSQPQCVRSAQDISIRGLFTEGRLSAQKMPNLVKAQLLSQGCWSYQGGKHKKLCDESAVTCAWRPYTLLSVSREVLLNYRNIQTSFQKSLPYQNDAEWFC